MITKQAILECTRCGKIFIGWERDVPPKGGPTCLKCQTRQAWNVLSSTVEAGKARIAGGTRKPARKPAARKVARKKVAKRAVASAARTRPARPRA